MALKHPLCFVGMRTCSQLIWSVATQAWWCLHTVLTKQLTAVGIMRSTLPCSQLCFTEFEVLFHSHLFWSSVPRTRGRNPAERCGRYLASIVSLTLKREPVARTIVLFG